MEKLIYVVWKPDGMAPDRFRAQMLGDVAPRLIDLGVRALSMNLADDRVVPGLRITQMAEPLTGTVSVWLDSALNRSGVEAVLSASTAHFAGYLALESVPLVNTAHVVPLGERLPGLYTVAFLEKPDALTYAAWLELWQGRHTPIAIATQSTFLYIQNVLVRPLTADVPPWTAIVEEAFPAEAAVDPMIFYDAAGSPATLQAHQNAMLASCQRFIDFSRFETHPMSAYDLKR